MIVYIASSGSHQKDEANKSSGFANESLSSSPQAQKGLILS